MLSISPLMLRAKSLSHKQTSICALAGYEKESLSTFNPFAHNLAFSVRVRERFFHYPKDSFRPPCHPNLRVFSVNGQGYHQCSLRLPLHCLRRKHHNAACFLCLDSLLQLPS